MATDPGTIEFLLDQLGRRESRYTTRRMFGEYCLYRDGLPVALVCDDTLFVKDTDAGREAVASMTTPEFRPPYPGAKLHLRVSPDAWDEGDWLRRVLDVTAGALPPPKPRPAKKPAAAKNPTAKNATSTKAGSKKTGSPAPAKPAPATPEAVGRDAAAKRPPAARSAAPRAAKKVP